MLILIGNLLVFMYMLSVQIADIIHCKFSRQRHGDAPVNGANMKVSTRYEITIHDGISLKQSFFNLTHIYMRHWALIG